MEERLMSMLHAQSGTWTALAVHWSLKLLLALMVLVIGIRIAKWLSGLVMRAMERANVEPTATIFLGKVAYGILLVTLVLAILQGVFDVAPTSLIAVIGAAGLAIGLALKDSLSNVASGVMLVSLKPFRVGNVVTIAGKTGKVESISIFQTRLRGADNQTIVLPNSLVTTDSITNLTPGSTRRIELVIGIGYGDDIDHARAEALRVMHDEPRVLADPAPDVLVYELGESTVKLGIRCHVANSDYFVTKCELTERIKKAFDAAKISFPFPQRVVHHTYAGGGEGQGPGDEHEQMAKQSKARASHHAHTPSEDPE